MRYVASCRSDWRTCNHPLSVLRYVGFVTLVAHNLYLRVRVDYWHDHCCALIRRNANIRVTERFSAASSATQ
jgi:hypothetical protein